MGHWFQDPPRSHSRPSASRDSNSANTEGGLYFILAEECFSEDTAGAPLNPLYHFQATELCLVFCPRFLACLVTAQIPQHQFPFPEALFLPWKPAWKNTTDILGDLFPRAQQEKGDYIKNTFNCCGSVWLNQGRQKPWFMRQSPDPERMIQAGEGSAIYTDWVNLIASERETRHLISPARTAVHLETQNTEVIPGSSHVPSRQGQHGHHSRCGLRRGQNAVLLDSFSLLEPDRWEATGSLGRFIF